jgi:TPR repeat protein
MGNIDACYNLGVCLRRGLGTARDDVEAERYYRAAAEKGHQSAQLALGSLKAQSATGAVDWLESARWYRLAAAAGNPAAMSALEQLLKKTEAVN